MSTINAGDFLKQAAIVSNFLGRNISKANRDLDVLKGTAEGIENGLRNATKPAGLFRKHSPLSEKDIEIGTRLSRNAVKDGQVRRNNEVMKTFKTRLGVGAVGSGAGAVAVKQKMDDNINAEPNYTETYEPDNYKYITAESAIAGMMLKEAAISAKQVGQMAKGVKDGFKSDVKAVKDRFHSGLDFSSGNAAKDILTFSRSRNAQKAISFANGKSSAIPKNATPETIKKVSDLRKDLFELKHYEDLSKKHKGMADEAGKAKFMGSQRAHETRMDASDLGGVYKKKYEGVSEHAKASKNYRSAADDVASQVAPDMENLSKYRDNELTKSLGVYGGIGGGGFVAKKIIDGKKGEDK